jgi:hypothetical protein
MGKNSVEKKRYLLLMELHICGGKQWGNLLPRRLME